MGFLTGKKALIVGLASTRSIAYGIAKVFHEQGAQLALTYQNDKLKSRVLEVAQTFGNTCTYECDVANDTHIQQLMDSINEQWQSIDILVHSVAYAPADQLNGDFLENINREGFRIAQDISAYSFAALTKAALPLMQNTQGAVLTLSYYGAEKAIPNYNTMGVAKASLEAMVRYMAVSLGSHGIRANAISAGPIRTLAASGIKDLRKMMTANAEAAPLRRNINIEEVGNAAAFLCSHLASGITGEILHVDAGYHAVSGGVL